MPPKKGFHQSGEPSLNSGRDKDVCRKNLLFYQLNGQSCAIASFAIDWSFYQIYSPFCKTKIMQQIWTQIINRMNFPITKGSSENCLVHIEAIDFWSKRKAKSFPDNLPLHQVQLVIQPAPVAALPLQPLRVLRLLRSRSGQVAAPRQRWNKRQGCQNWVRTRTPKFLAWINWESTALEKATGKLDEWVKTSSLPLVCQYVDSSVRLHRSL